MREGHAKTIESGTDHYSLPEEVAAAAVIPSHQGTPIFASVCSIITDQIALQKIFLYAET